MGTGSPDFGIYKYQFTGPATPFVLETWRNHRAKLQKEARLIVALGQLDSYVTDHLAFRHPIQIEGPQYGAIDKKNLHAVLGNYENAERHLDSKLRYGILNWTPVQDDGIANEVYFLHTWGVNLESMETTDAKYVFAENKFSMTRYTELLDIMFGIVYAAAEHLKEKGKPVVVRMTGLGLGVWSTEIPKGKKQKVLDTYRQKLGSLSRSWLHIRHPHHPRMITESIVDGEWKTVELNHDPFGDYPNRENTTVIEQYPKNATVMIVNAWDDGSFVGNGGAQDNSMDGWTVAGGAKFYKMELDKLEEDIPEMEGKRLGANIVNASYLHNVFFTPSLLDSKKWIRSKTSL